MKTRDVKEISTVRMNPLQALKDPTIRYQHYIKVGFDYPEEFLVGYYGLTLIFSDSLSYPKMEEAEKLFRGYAKADTTTSRKQNERMKRIIKEFGKQGVLVALNMFKYCHPRQYIDDELIIAKAQLGGRSHDGIQFLSI